MKTAAEQMQQTKTSWSRLVGIQQTKLKLQPLSFPETCMMPFIDSRAEALYRYMSMGTLLLQ